MINHWDRVERELSRWKRPESVVQEARATDVEWRAKPSWSVLRAAMEEGLPWPIEEGAKAILRWSNAALFDVFGRRRSVEVIEKHRVRIVP